MATSDAIIIRITGDSGDGVQLMGEELTITAALAGREVRTLPDFPAEIRAPMGTVAGVSGFQLAMAEKALFTAGEELDVLVALNPAALKKSYTHLSRGGLLIVNEDSMQEKDWERAGCDRRLLRDLEEQVHVISVPLITYTLQAVEGINITQPQAKKAKNFYVLGLVLWLFDLEPDHCKTFIAKKFKAQPFVAEANEKALMAGYHYAMTLELSRRDYMLGHVDRPHGDYRQITGVQATGLALAVLATHAQKSLLVSGYPITPASAILQESAKLSAFGVRLFQAEDEIAAICACLGAAYGGHLALTCTSGPGLDLKSEALGLGIVSELPLVVIDVQRAGASTGMPTKTGQSDLREALYGRHGEAPLPVIAASTPADCFNTVIEAFNIAVRYMTPVIVLMDAYLANAAEPWKIPNVDSLVLPDIKHNQCAKPYERDEHLARSWNVPGTPGFIHQLGGLEKQGEEGRVSYEPENHQHMVDLRAKKIMKVADVYRPLCIEGEVDASVLLIGWGSTYGSLKAAEAACEAEGMPIALLHLRNLHPLPHDLGSILQKFSHIFVAELNSGHLAQLLRATYLKDIQSITQCNGQPLSTSMLIQHIKASVYYEKDSVSA